MNAMEVRVCDYLEQNRAVWIDFLRRMVAAESCNPPGDTREVASIIVEKLQEQSISCEQVTEVENKQSLIASIGEGDKCLLFNAHMDTVPVGEPHQWFVDPFKEPPKENILYGRGSADDKGGLAAMVAAMYALKSCGVELKGRLMLNPVADEETGGVHGTGYLVKNDYLKPDYVVVGEITTNEVAIVHKGLYWFEITSYGRTAHASTPWEGTNAISHMVALLHELEEYYKRELPLHTDPLTPPASYNIGTINGGLRPNVVADKCTVVVDRRTLAQETMEMALAEIQAVIESIEKKYPDARFSCTVLNESPSLLTAPDEPLVKTALEVVREFGRKPEPVGYQQSSDGRFFSALGIPTVLIGPGDPTVGHKPNECIDLNEVIECAKIYAVLSMRILGY